MSEQDRASAYLHSPRGAIRHVNGFGGYRIGEAKLVRGHQSVGHDPDPVTPCDGCNRSIDIGSCLPLQQSADPWHVVQAMTNSTKLSRLHQSRQRLVNSLATAEVQEVLRRTCPLPTTACSHPLHDLVGYSRHFDTVSSNTSVKYLLNSSDLNKHVSMLSHRYLVNDRYRRSATPGSDSHFGERSSIGVCHAARITIRRPPVLAARTASECSSAW